MKRVISLAILVLTYCNLLGQSVPEVQPALDFLAKYQNVRDFALSKKQDEAYLTIQSPFGDVSVIVQTKLQNGKWTAPQLVSFTGEYSDLEPFLSPDQLRLYFVSNRPVGKSGTAPKDYDIWYVERKNRNSQWSEPINAGSPVNTQHNEFYPSVSANNNLYFTSDAPGSMGKDDIYFSRWDGKKYAPPAPLDSAINSPGYEYNAFVSEKEDFLIYTKYGTPDGMGSGDLYISYKNPDGTWQKPTNLGQNINSKYMDYCPYFDSKTGYLYFTSRRNSIAPAKFNSLAEFEKTINQYENGYSRIYKVELQSIKHQ